MVWTLLDAENNLALDTLDGEVATLAREPFGDVSIRKWTLLGGMSQGVDVVEVTSGGFRMRILPTRGMGVWDAHYDGQRIGWSSPTPGPVHPAFVPISEPSGIGWLEGFDELLVRCGLESNGAPEFDPQTHRLLYPLHGRIANKPAQKVTAEITEDGEVIVRGEVYETRLFFCNLKLTVEYRIARGERGFRLKDTITNLSAKPAEAQMLYHINLGDPVLSEGATVVVPAKKVVPRNDHSAGEIGNWDRYRGPQVGFEEMVYFCENAHGEDGWTPTMLKNGAGDRGISVAYDARQLPCFTIWKNTAAEADGYVTGLEPATNFPNPRSFEGKQNRVVKLPPGGEVNFEIQLAYHANAEAVAEMEQSIRSLAKEPAHLLDAPHPLWCS
ncbi:aldose 1-epimerase family protein [Blastopirellula sp. JC732]|uniref:Aldose 1-epimerase family protein n=1 Tax=Blastopirellula sediminis TaxID=2894196 RepID=A0A9X1MP07_9BACT|nr:aldose 1-epimerase family protein [Blastopirellula sediminis]MCC9629700.1 aldose 1-epimerase family protein [Blastopirellula sediminis]